MHPLDWLWDNRTWLFSGLGVAVLAALFAVARSAHTRVRHTSAPSGPTPMQGSVVPAATRSHAVAPGQLTPKDIIQAIHDAPLLQQPDVAKHYVGLAVEWQGKLQSAERTDRGAIRITAVHDGRHLVGFELEPSSYPGLGLLRSGTQVRFAGVIASVDLDWIALEDARLLSAV
jgi:hypothetical protein